MSDLCICARFSVNTSHPGERFFFFRTLVFLDSRLLTTGSRKCFSHTASAFYSSFVMFFGTVAKGYSIDVSLIIFGIEVAREGSDAFYSFN